MAGAESFTVLAILEARDRASEVFAKVDESLGRFSDTARSAADTAKAAGDSIDESLLKTASGADALDVATARVEAAQEKATRTAEAQADAERNLLEVHKAAAAAADDDVAAQYRLMEADQRMTVAANENAAAQKSLSDATKLQADTATAAAAKNDEAAAGAAAVRDSSEASALSLGRLGKVAGITALGMGVAGAIMVKAAGNFQDSTTHLVTDAGESAKNLAMVQAGILNVSTATGTSASQITNAMYHIESGGYHGAAGLTMLKVAAEGARVGGADLDTVSKTLVGTMNAYGLSASHSASFMNQLIATVGAGDMRMQDLASSLSNVAPLAAKVGLSFAQVGGAIATMTAQGMSAQQSTQDLSNTIRALSNPNNVAINEMQQLGINSQTVAKNLGREGLTGTINELTTAITSHMGKSGMVLMSTFNQAKFAAADANTEIKAMPSSLQALAKGFLSGSITAKSWRTDLQALPPVQQHLMQQFATTAEKAHSFNTLLAAGGPAAQTYTAALAKMMGGATGLNTALMLTGTNAAVLRRNVDTISAAARKAGGDVDNWSTIQSTFNYKMQAAKVGVENTGIAIGSALLPAATSLLSVILKVVEPIAEWTAKHRTLTEVLFAGVAAVAATIAIVAGLRKAYGAVKSTIDTVKTAVSAVTGLFKSSAATQATAAEAGAAAEEEAAAEGAAAQEEAAAESSSSWIASAATTAGAWIAAAASGVASAAVWVAGSVAKVAVMVASNVAGAAVSMAAWIAANAAMLLGIGLVVVAVAAGIFLIVKYWKDIEKAAVAVWDAILKFVKQWWPLLLGVATGGIGLLVGLIIKYHTQILKFIEKTWNAVLGFVDGLWHDITSAASSAWHGFLSLIQTVHNLIWKVIDSVWSKIKSFINTEVNGVKNILGWFGKLGGLFGGWWNDAVNAVRSAGDRLISFVKGIPGRILGALGDVGHLLWNAGAKIIQGLIGGIGSMIGSVGHAISGIAGEITSHLPFSPAKKGPLSGSGSPDKSGRSIARMVAQGMVSGKSDVTSAAHLLASSAALGPGTGAPVPAAGGGLTALGGGTAAGGATIVLDIHGNMLMTERDMDVLVQKLGPTVTRALAQAGVKVRMG